MPRVLEAFADLAVQAPRRVLVGAAVFAVISAAFGLETPRLLGRGVNEFVAGGSESIRAQAAIQRASGLSAAPQVLVLVRRPTPARVGRVRSVLQREPAFPLITKPLLSRDRSEAIVPAYANAHLSEHEWSLAAERVTRRLRPVPGVAVGGPAIAITQVNDQVEHDLAHEEELAFPLLFLLAQLAG